MPDEVIQHLVQQLEANDEKKAKLEERLWCIRRAEMFLTEEIIFHQEQQDRYLKLIQQLTESNSLYEE
jgi:hypothetical protein